MKKEMNSQYYNIAYGSNEQYHRNPKDCYYYPLWKEVLNKINKDDKILELGCGSGQFAKMCNESGLNYILGIDFSSTAIDIAKKMAGNKFKIADVYKGIPNIEYDVIVMSEFLEHLKDDIAVINMIPSGKTIIATLPDFNARAHVRFFPNDEDVLHRYQKIIDFKMVKVFMTHPAGMKQKFYVIYGKKV